MPVTIDSSHAPSENEHDRRWWSLYRLLCHILVSPRCHAGHAPWPFPQVQGRNRWPWQKTAKCQLPWVSIQESRREGVSNCRFCRSSCPRLFRPCHPHVSATDHTRSLLKHMLIGRAPCVVREPDKSANIGLDCLLFNYLLLWPSPIPIGT